MLDAFDTDISERPRAENVTDPRTRQAAPPVVRDLRHGDVLFQAGDSRGTIYRVQRGSLCHYITWPDGRHEVIEFAFPGDIVGLGYTDSHISTTQAMVDSAVATVALEEFEDLLAQDGPLAMRMAAAADREFEMLRQRATAGPSGSPVARVAAYLLAIFAVEASEGRSSSNAVSPASLSLLEGGPEGLPRAVWEEALSKLIEREMLVRTGEGVSISNLCELQRAAEGH